MIKQLISILKAPVCVFILTIFSISTMNWLCIQFLAHHCATSGFIGLIKNILNLGSPVCMFVNHLQITLADYYIFIWSSSLTICITWVTTNCGYKLKSE